MYAPGGTPGYGAPPPGPGQYPSLAPQGGAAPGMPPPPPPPGGYYAPPPQQQYSGQPAYIPYQAAPTHTWKGGLCSCFCACRERRGAAPRFAVPLRQQPRSPRARARPARPARALTARPRLHARAQQT